MRNRRARRPPRATRATRDNTPTAMHKNGDIEQTIVLGAHGPYRVHVLVLG